MNMRDFIHDGPVPDDEDEQLDALMNAIALERARQALEEARRDWIAFRQSLTSCDRRWSAVRFPRRTPSVRTGSVCTPRGDGR